MKYSFLLIILGFFTSYTLFSQDIIITERGDKIKGDVQNSDSTHVYFDIYKNNRKISTKIALSNVDTIIYGQRNFYIRSLKQDLVKLGIGVGLDYGGFFGANVMVTPHKRISFFAGGGYLISTAGFNVGARMNIVANPSTLHVLFLEGMYGYNTFIYVKNMRSLNRAFYGPSLGIGFGRKMPGLGIIFESTVFLPIRGDDVDSYMRHLITRQGVVFENELPPIAISFGVKF